MGSDIAYCQREGVKVILNIGGSTKFIGFASKNESQVFAMTMWRLFLGGVGEAGKNNLPRTFGYVSKIISAKVTNWGFSCCR